MGNHLGCARHVHLRRCRVHLVAQEAAISTKLADGASALDPRDLGGSDPCLDGRDPAQMVSGSRPCWP